jgi:hypothetical protein
VEDSPRWSAEDELDALPHAVLHDGGQLAHVVDAPLKGRAVVLVLPLVGDVSASEMICRTAGVNTASESSWSAPFTGLSPRAFGKRVTVLWSEGADAARQVR